MSTTFVNGPAGLQILMLARSPRFLRAVRSAAGVWDALDQPADAPAQGEQIYVYRRLGNAFVGFVDWHDGRGRRGGRFSFARYTVVDPQPADQVLRVTAAWQEWCRAAAAAADAEPTPPAEPTDAEVVDMAVAAATERYGLPDVQTLGRRCRRPGTASDGQASLFGGQP